MMEYYWPSSWPVSEENLLGVVLSQTSQVIAAVSFCILSGGIFFGFVKMRRVFIADRRWFVA